MSKENLLDNEVVIAVEPKVEIETVQLDDLSLALVGGGNCVVTF
jgi:hypothetical protein